MTQLLLKTNKTIFSAIYSRLYDYWRWNSECLEKKTLEWKKFKQFYGFYV